MIWHLEAYLFPLEQMRLIFSFWLLSKCIASICQIFWYCAKKNDAWKFKRGLIKISSNWHIFFKARRHDSSAAVEGAVRQGAAASILFDTCVCSSPVGAGEDHLFPLLSFTFTFHRFAGPSASLEHKITFYSISKCLNRLGASILLSWCLNPRCALKCLTETVLCSTYCAGLRTVCRDAAAAGCGGSSSRRLSAPAWTSARPPWWWWPLPRPAGCTPSHNFGRRREEK